jgi:hypothetical protein
LKVSTVIKRVLLSTTGVWCTPHGKTIMGPWDKDRFSEKWEDEVKNASRQIM